MGGTRIGGLQARDSNKGLYGEDFYQRIGQLGGLRKVPKGVAVNGRAAEIGAIGGAKSKRTWTPEQRLAQSRRMKHLYKRFWEIWK